MRYLIVLSKGDKWRKRIRLSDQPWMPEHAVYVQQRYDAGEVLIAGPFEDQSGGAILIEVENEEEAFRFAQHDPAVINSIFQYELKPWPGLMNKYENRSPNFDQGYIDYKHQVQKESNIIE